MNHPSIGAGRTVLKERPYTSANGYAMTAVAVLVVGLGVLMLVRHIGPVALGVALALAGIALMLGLYVLQPNEASVLTLFGKYQGTDRSEGLRWTNPLQAGKKISLRARNLN